MKNQIYEFVVLLSPELSEQDLTRKQDAILDLIKKYKGKMESIDVWGRKPLAYKVKNFSEATYLFYTLTLPKENVLAFDRDVRLMDAVIRYLIVKQGEKIAVKPVEPVAEVKE